MMEMVHPLTGDCIRLASLPEWAEGIDKGVLFMNMN
jgi:hypothetical protein